MNIGESLNALRSISSNFNKIPGRLADAMHNPESKEGVENVMTDMLVEKNSFIANTKAIKTMNTVEDILLNDLRDS